MFFHYTNNHAIAPQCYVIRTQTFLLVTTYQSTWRHTTVDLNLQPERSNNPTSRTIRGIFCGVIACGQSLGWQTYYQRGHDMSLWYAANLLLVLIPTNTGYLIAASLAIRNINWRAQHRVKECNALNYAAQNTCHITIHGRWQAMATMHDHMLPINWTYTVNCFAASYCSREHSAVVTQISLF